VLAFHDFCNVNVPLVLCLSSYKNKAIIKCLEYINENSTISPDGTRSISLTILSEFAEEILYEYVQIDKNIPERTKRNVILSAIFRWLKYKKTNNQLLQLNYFQRAVNAEVLRISKNKRIFSVLMFLNVDTESISEFNEIEILGDKLRFISWQDLSRLNIKNLWSEVKFHKPETPILWIDRNEKEPLPNIIVFSPVVIEINTYDSDGAVELAVDRIDILRGILNISYVLGRYTYFRSQPEALSKILPSPIYVSFDKEGNRNIFYTTESFKYKQEKITNEQKSSIQFLLSKICEEPKPNSTWAYILNILRLYQKALDTSIAEVSYLTMWQVLENSINLGEKSLKNRDIHARIKVLVKLDPISLEILDILFDKRNEFVHSGKYLQEGDRLFFILKFITDFVIRSLISLADKYPTLIELKEYVAFHTLSNSDLERKKLVIEKIIEKRK